MNPRQRRGALLLALSVIGAVAVFVVVSGYVSEVRAMVGPARPILVLREPVPAYEPITPEAFALERVPARYVPEGALTQAEILSGVAAAELPEGTILQRGMVVPPPALEGDETEVAIVVDARTGVGGNIRPGDYVDIYATFGPEEIAAGVSRPACEARIITDALLLGVGTPSIEQRPDDEGALEPQEVVPVRFALSPLEIERLVFAESFAVEVRLSRIGSAERLQAIAQGSTPTLETQACRVAPGVFIEEVSGP